MVSRSREEVRFTSYLLQFLGHRAAYVDVLDALRAGCERGLFDIYLEPLELYIEYDGGYFHGHQRADRDAQKCLEKVLHEPHARVLRVRVGNAAELPQTQHARIAVVLARDFDTAVGAACRALATLVNAPRLAQVPARLVRCAERELVADQVLDQLNLNLSQQRAELVHGLGESAARRLAARGGALTRMQHGQFAQAVIRFMGELHLSVRQLLTVLVPSTLARIEAPEFVGAVRQFAADFELSTAQLVTLLGTGSVASRVEDASFAAVVDKGSLDALMGDAEDEGGNVAGMRFLCEVRRVLDTKCGTYVIVTLCQDHVLETILDSFSVLADENIAGDSKPKWSLCVCSIPVTRDMRDSPWKPFAVVATRKADGTGGGGEGTSRRDVGRPERAREGRGARHRLSGTGVQS